VAKVLLKRRFITIMMMPVRLSIRGSIYFWDTSSRWYGWGLSGFQAGWSVECSFFSSSLISQVKLLVSECQASGIHPKRAKLAKQKDNTAACLCFLNYLAFLRPAADRAVSILPWVVSRGRSYGFLWADSSTHDRRM
jgi:hypothetical protein